MRYIEPHVNGDYTTLIDLQNKGGWMIGGFRGASLSAMNSTRSFLRIPFAFQAAVAGIADLSEQTLSRRTDKKAQLFFTNIGLAAPRLAD